MKKTLARLAVLSAMLTPLLPLPAHAQSASNPNSVAWTGGYLGFGLGNYAEGAYCDDLRAESGTVQNGITFGTVTCEDSALAGRFYFGRRFHEHLAVEGGLTYTGDMSYTVNAVRNSDNASRNVTVEFHYQAFDLSLLGVYPISEQFEVYGRGGFAFWEYTNEGFFDIGISPSDFSEDGTDLLYGSGINYVFYADSAGSAALNFDWTHIGGDVKSNLLTATLDIRFKLQQ